MNDRDDDSGLKELEARLKQARVSTDRRNGDGPENSRGPARGVGFAARIGTDILAALVVGLGLGWFLDRWLGTAPFAMMVFFVLGAAAGIRNAYRLANRTMGEIDAEEKAGQDAGGRDAANRTAAGDQPGEDGKR